MPGAALNAHAAMYRIAAALLVLFVSAVLVATIRSWMDWGGDDAMYIMNARTIALGQPYGVTAYIHNPLNAIHPAAPPPGLPLLLAPVYSVWGLDWVQFKLTCVVALCLFLAVFAAIAGERLSPVWALAVVAIAGLHPYTWQMKETIPPEFPFMFFAYAALWLGDRSITSNARAKRLYLSGAAICIAAAYLIRPIGIVLLPAIVLASLYQTRRLFNAGIAAAVIGFALAWGVERLVHPDLGTYMNYMQGFGLQSIGKNIKAYNIAFRHFLEDHTYARTLRGAALLTAVLAVIVTGFVVRVRARLSAFEWFTLGYAGLLLIYPINLEPDRYSYPLWPLMLIYAFAGCEWIGNRLGGWLRYVPAALLTGVLLVNYGIVYHRIVRHSGADRAEAKAINAAYDHMKRHLPADAVVIARQPTVVALLTNRRSAIWPAHCDDQQFRGYMQSIGAQYVLVDSDDDSAAGGQLDELGSFLSHNRQTLQLVYSHGPIQLYRVGS
jgi:hypothetical protein